MIYKSRFRLISLTQIINNIIQAITRPELNMHIAQLIQYSFGILGNLLFFEKKQPAYQDGPHCFYKRLVEKKDAIRIDGGDA